MGFINLLKECDGFRRLVFIGMKLDSQTPEGTLDFPFTCLAVDAQYLIIVFQPFKGK